MNEYITGDLTAMRAIAASQENKAQGWALLLGILEDQNLSQEEVELIYSAIGIKDELLWDSIKEERVSAEDVDRLADSILKTFFLQP